MRSTNCWWIPEDLLQNSRKILCLSSVGLLSQPSHVSVTKQYVSIQDNVRQISEINQLKHQVFGLIAQENINLMLFQQH